MMVVGILGAGFMGTTHAQAYSHLPAVRGVVIYDHHTDRAARLAGHVGGRVASSLDMVLQDPQIDLVDVCLPTDLHAEYGMRALAAGKHVLCEKPLAHTLADADKLLAAWEQSGRLLMVGHVVRFFPAYAAVRGLVADGQLGRPLFVTASRVSHRPQWAGWFDDPARSGGAVLDLLIHDLDVMCWLFGPPQTVFARGVRGGSGGWDHVSALLTFASGLSASVEGGHLMPRDFPFTTQLRLLCENAAVELDQRAEGGSFENGVARHSAVIHWPGRPNQPLTLADGDPFQHELGYFVNCVETNTPPTLITPPEARQAVALALAVRQALESGEITPLATSRGSSHPSIRSRKEKA